jgi:hypothetical protein
MEGKRSMFNSLSKSMRLVLPLVLLLGLATGLAVQAQTEEPVPGTLTSGVLTRETDVTAQVFSLNGLAGENIRLTATSNDGLALALVLSDANGAFIAQERDLTATGETALQAQLPTDGVYYVTVLPVQSTGSLADGTYALVLETNGFVAGPGVTVEATEAAEATVETTDAAAQPTAPVVVPTVEVPTVEATQVVTEVLSDAPAVVVTSGGMQVSLVWNSTANLDLEVRDPVGGTLYFNSPVSEFGGTFGQNVNGGCEALVGNNATEQVTWTPGGIPAGSYEILVYYQNECENNGPVTFSVNPVVDGQALTPISGTMLPGQVYVGSYVVAADGTAVTSQLNGIKGDEQLPASAAVLIQAAQPIAVGQQVAGSLTSQQPYQSYSFTAAANDVVTILHNATSGSLDTYVALLDPSGNVLYFNDDSADGVTDAALRNSLLPVAGNYTIVATRYGLTVGGTEGDYTLTLSGPATTTPGVETTTDPNALLTATLVPAVLPADVQALNLPVGNIEVTLVWNSAADVQLLVRDPAGEAVFDDSPQIRSGGTLGAAGNVNCTVADTTPVSYIYWPQNITPRAGAYEIDVWFQNECNDTTPVNFTLYVSVGGQQVLTQSLPASRPFLQGEHYITSFTIDQSGVVTPGEGGVDGIATIDWQAEAASALPIVPGDAISGSITATNKFDLYAFEAFAGDTVTIAMNRAPAANLDTKLYLIGPNGAVVAQNDDALAGENTDSLISNFTLPDDGQYIIIATHYGDRYGVTSGAYTLSLSQ